MIDLGFYNMDCMDGMRQFPDKYFDLAIVDPPYGGGGQQWEMKPRSRFGGRFDKYKVERTGGTWANKYGKEIKHWDIAPSKEYFEELFRVSKNQIVFGGNYFNEYLPSNRNFIVWRKLTISESFSMAMAEYAWTSIHGNAKVFECAPQGSIEKRFHPTQKPIRLYTWLLNNYAKPGDKILDTHVGSASSLIACQRAQRTGCDMCGFGIHIEKRPHRFDRLKEDNPKAWQFWLKECVTDADGNKFGWGKVLDWIGIDWENHIGATKGQISFFDEEYEDMEDIFDE